jgi:hypothetical protein
VDDTGAEAVGAVGALGAEGKACAMSVGGETARPGEVRGDPEFVVVGISRAGTDGAASSMGSATPGVACIESGTGSASESGSPS